MNLKSILARKAGDVTAQRAIRLNKVGIRVSDNYVEKLQVQADGIEEKISDLLDINANVDHNAGQGKVSNTDIENIILQYHELKEKLYLLNQRIAVASSINEELKAEEEEVTSTKKKL